MKDIIRPYANVLPSLLTESGFERQKESQANKAELLAFCADSAIPGLNPMDHTVSVGGAIPACLSCAHFDYAERDEEGLGYGGLRCGKHDAEVGRSTVCPDWDPQDDK